jgi:hypothetical protein
VLPNLEGRGPSQRKKTRTATEPARHLKRRGNWQQVTEGRAHGLYEAWWGKDITERTITISDDLDNDAGDVSEGGPDNDASDGSSPPPPGIPSVHKIVNIDHAISGKKAIGEILLREEFLTTLAFIESLASRRPESGVIVTGQPGIGEHRC